MIDNDLFHPRSIAVVGASAGPMNVHSQMFLDNLVGFGFQGKIYPINPGTAEISGLKAYPNLAAVPGPVDLVTSLIPAASTPRLIRECVAAGVKTVQLFTAGFAETGEPEETRLQDEIVEIARQGNVRLIGPNCVGIYCPASGITYCSDFPREPGDIAFITQSGSYTYLTVRMAAPRGVRFSKVVSMGNAADVNEIELLEYLAEDPDTAVIGAYIEGTRDGARFFRVLKETAERKPVIVIKKGSTAAGRRGTSSHTGAMSGDDMVWDTAIKQAGAIRVEDAEEMVDLLTTFTHFPVPQSRRTVVVGAGGGVSVRASDQCEAGGLVLPPIPDKLRDQLAGHISAAGSMLRNPVDVLPERVGQSAWEAILGALDSWEDVDLFLWQICPEIEPFREEEFRKMVVEVRRGMMGTFRRLSKPKAVAVQAVESGPGLASLDALRTICQEHEIAFYPSVVRAARAIGLFMDYQSRTKTGSAG